MSLEEKLRRLIESQDCYSNKNASSRNHLRQNSSKEYPDDYDASLNGYTGKIGNNEYSLNKSDIFTFGISELLGFGDTSAIISNLKNGQTELVSIRLLDPADAQRAIDFLAGATYMLGGNQFRISEEVFLFAQNLVGDYDISSLKQLCLDRYNLYILSIGNHSKVAEPNYSSECKQNLQEELPLEGSQEYSLDELKNEICSLIDEWTTNKNVSFTAEQVETFNILES